MGMVRKSRLGEVHSRLTTFGRDWQVQGYRQCSRLDPRGLEMPRDCHNMIIGQQRNMGGHCSR